LAIFCGSISFSTIETKNISARIIPQTKKFVNIFLNRLKFYLIYVSF
jgi:hypothetical protein